MTDLLFCWSALWPWQPSPCTLPRTGGLATTSVWNTPSPCGRNSLLWTAPGMRCSSSVWCGGLHDVPLFLAALMKGLTQRIELMLLSLGNVLIILGSKERNRVGGAMLRV